MHTRRSALACRRAVIFDPVIFFFARLAAFQLRLGRLFLEEAFDLRRRKFFVGPFRQAVQFQPADADTGQACDLVTEVVEHHADLTLEPHLENDVRPVVAVHPGAFRTGETFFGHHALDEFRHHVRIERLIDDHFVFFFSTLTRVNDPVGEISAIRQENQAFAVFIETADMMQILVLQRQQIVNRHAVLLVPTGAQVAFRLVQNENDRRLGTYRRTIDDHLVLGLDLRGKLGDDVSVDGHATAEDDFLRATP